MICVKCNKDIPNLQVDNYNTDRINILCVDCSTSEECVENGLNIREHLEDRLRQEVDDYIVLMGVDRIEMMILGMNVTRNYTDVFRRSVKKLYDIDYEDVIINGPEWVQAKIRENTINNILDD
tara:strand:- start:476 stop:844 length:369 start_codon:yes stop_codon:yes gene_type:complete